MSKTKKRIIIIAVSAVLSVLLISSIFSVMKFGTFNCFSSFPAFFRVACGSEDVIAVDGYRVLMCSPTDSAEKLISYMESTGAVHNADEDLGGRLSFTKDSETFEMALRVNGNYALLTRV